MSGVAPVGVPVHGMVCMAHRVRLQKLEERHDQDHRRLQRLQFKVQALQHALLRANDVIVVLRDEMENALADYEEDANTNETE